ncbi:MAG: DUF4358 domain-containing protein [Lachnospiraceae bacterium]|nr:DUF4358 domain-containing protein [uncultured Acetatifactor sp.]MCI9218801.1 DUF4358 domain-containing protein [Lachnospiraceae bacterium]
MKKKTIALLCAALLAVSATACGGNGKDGSADAESSTGQESGGESSEESVPSESMGTPSESMETSSESAETPSDGAGAEGDGTDGIEEGWSQEMEQLKAAAVEAAEGGYWPDMALPPDMLEMSFGITSDMYDDYMAEMPMMSAHVDTLLIVKAKEDKLETVQEIVEDYREAKVNDTMQYPMNLGKIQASQVETIGNYVVFVMLGGDTTDVEEQGDEAVVKTCQERNGKVIEAIRGQL